MHIQDDKTILLLMKSSLTNIEKDYKHGSSFQVGLLKYRSKQRPDTVCQLYHTSNDE